MQHIAVQPPADVPKNKIETYIKNYNAVTQNSKRLFLFACDQKVEHLNADFYGDKIHPDAHQVSHIFEIARQGRIGALATHLGLIARYAKQYPTINYIAKLNGSSHLAKTEDPYSKLLWHVQDVIAIQEQHTIPIRGIGYTLYLGSTYEPEMLSEAAHLVSQAHQHGLLAILWVYARGKNISNETDPKLLAGAAGIAASLGADFVKIKAPNAINDLLMITAAAGNCGVICSGGSMQEPNQFLKNLSDQIHIGNASGCATGRNIFQKSLPEAVAFTHAIATIVFDNQQL
ncbi:MAG TPA: hypothetical protein VGT41_04870 [Candidatus Babeliales bacterium]|nr:hypothetical protein [Candidatus Babeliales bacterium]